MEILPVTKEDTEELLAIYAPYVTDTAITFEYETPTFEDFESRIVNISSRLPYIKVVENGEISGYAYASTFKGRAAYDWSVETTVYIKESQRGRGLGRILYDELERLLKGIGILNMNACIAVPKVEDKYLTMDSIYFHEKMGFQTVGTFHDSGYKFNTWYDMIWMEKMIGEHTENAEPVRFGEWLENA